MTQSNAYQGVNPTSTAIHTITNMRISDYYRPLNSRYPGLVTHHIYPSYNDSSRSERYSNTHQASVDRFLAQEDYGTNCLDGFPGIPVMRTQENTDFQAAACRFQRPKAEEILLSNSTCHRQLPQEHQCSYYPQQQIIPNGPNSLEFFCPPPTSADNSTPPTPVDSSTTFQFELHSLYGQKNVNHQTPLTSEDDPFVLNSYNQTQQSQDDGLDLYNI
ncbi:hypothetical protein BD408DRAFT_89547 [Parasitella parasitica]|nr:hypothetical protein BD408DRAFT_89547 [Parasitella parasitica]